MLAHEWNPAELRGPTAARGNPAKDPER
jgi:hypothetical protein